MRVSVGIFVSAVRLFSLSNTYIPEHPPRQDDGPKQTEGQGWIERWGRARQVGQKLQRLHTKQPFAREASEYLRR